MRRPDSATPKSTVKSIGNNGAQNERTTTVTALNQSHNQMVAVAGTKEQAGEITTTRECLSVLQIPN